MRTLVAMKRFRAMFADWATRRSGAGYRPSMQTSSQIGKAARDVIGPTGMAFSNAWEKLDQHGNDYMKSFNPHTPPSLFVSERDRLRRRQVVPLSERCIEDWNERHGRPSNPPKPGTAASATPDRSPGGRDDDRPANPLELGHR